jgi:hypothetical protein
MCRARPSTPEPFTYVDAIFNLKALLKLYYTNFTVRTYLKTWMNEYFHRLKRYESVAIRYWAQYIELRI